MPTGALSSPASAIFVSPSAAAKRNWIAGIASAVLFISLFLPWFGVSFLGMTVTADGLESHGYLRIALIFCLAIVGYLILRISPIQSVLPAPRTHEWILLAVTTINFALVIIAFIATPGGFFVGRQYGSFVGGIAALTAVVPTAISLLLGLNGHRPRLSR